MKDKTPEQLNRKQESALLALLAEGSVKAASTKCNVSEATLWRWLREEPAFQDRYREARTMLVDSTIARLQSASDAAVTTLLEIAQDSSAAPTARIAAARAILSNAFRGVDVGSVGAPVPTHLHLCGECLEKFECKGRDCEEFEFAKHPGCSKEREKQREKHELEH